MAQETMLEIRRVALETLAPDPANARAHGEVNLDAIEGSLRRFGQAEPLVVQAGTRRVIAGHGRLAAMKSLGWAECDIVEVEVDALQATALGIALNRTAELAAWDEPVLVRLLSELRTAEALEGVGFTDSEIDDLFRELGAAGDLEDVEDPGPGEPPNDPVTRTGDLWILGRHRLLCGDSTRLEDVQRVVGDTQAALCATDPPYLVDYTGERPNNSGKDWSATYREIDIQDADGFFRAVFANVIKVLAPNAAIYCWHAHKRCGVIQRVWEDLGILDHQQIVWVKPASVFGRVYWHFRHEPCMMGWVKGNQPEHNGQHEFDSVWEVDWDGKARQASDHPTSKPPELFARPMRKHTARGAKVFEPFSGSGSQLIAAENEGRTCAAIEISPAFVDVAIRRWEQATQKAATLDGDGRSFAEVSSERGTA